MFKNILISGFLCTLLSADNFPDKPIDFNTFIQKAIKNSPFLKSSILAVEQAKEDGNTLTRYKNPTLELEYSELSPNVGKNDNSYRINYSQPVRLWNVGDNKKALSRSIINSANAEFTQQKAIFIRDISMSFTSYAEKHMILELANEELNIAKSIYDISKARYESGTTSRGLMLQAKIDYETVQIANETLKLAANQSYYNLIKLAGIKEDFKFDISHTFVLINTNDNIENPSIKLLESKQNKSLSEAMVNSNSIEWINIIAEYEGEPEQDITRIGFNFPLALFNKRYEERRIATLQASRSQLLVDNETTILDIEMNRLKKERISLKNLHLRNEKILESEIELLSMFQNGYKIANINLLQLQDIKNKVISTKRNLIKINTALNQNAIITNYNQGSYND